MESDNTQNQDKLKEIARDLMEIAKNHTYDFSKEPDIEAYNKAVSEYLSKNVVVIEIDLIKEKDYGL